MNANLRTRLEPPAEKAVARQILALEAHVTALLSAIPAAVAATRDHPGRTGRTRAASVDRLEAAVTAAVADPRPDSASVRAAQKAWKEAQGLRWRLALSATRVAHREARRLDGNGALSRHDLVQEGMIGLLGAAKRFEPDQGVRFATYARWWVRAEMTRAIDQSRVVRLSAGACEQLRNLRKQIRIHENAGAEWSANQLAREMTMDPDRVRTLLAIGTGLSLDDTDENETSVGSQLMDHEMPAPDEVAATRQAVQHLRAALQTSLPERQRKILVNRYGIDQQPITLGEIAAGLSLSRERVRQLERDSLSRLREACSPHAESHHGTLASK